MHSFCYINNLICFFMGQVAKALFGSDLVFKNPVSISNF
jgi:hypothetical protein